MASKIDSTTNNDGVKEKRTVVAGGNAEPSRE